VCAMVLHHLDDPLPCLLEVFRIVRPGGTAVILELDPHRHDWMHDSLGDQHLGLDANLVSRRLEQAGFVDLSLEIVDDHYRPSPDADPSAGSEAALPLYIVRGRVPRDDR